MRNFLDLAIGRLLHGAGTALTPRSVLNFGDGITVTDDPTNDSTTLSVAGSGVTSIGAPVANLAALRALTPSTGAVVDGQQRQIKGSTKVYAYSSSTGAGFADDGAQGGTVIKPNEVLVGSNGRWYIVGAAPVVATYAAARLAVSGKYPTITVQARATLGDGGGGIFHDVTGVLADADDDGITLHAGSRILQRQYDGAIHAAWFGVSTDPAGTSTALQNAINAAAGQALVLDVGTYIADTSLALSDGIELLGFGASIKAKDATTYNAVITGDDLANVRVFGLDVDANGDNRTDTTNTKDGYRMVGMTDCVFDLTTVRNTLGTPGSAVAYALTNALRFRYIDAAAIDCGRVGRISDGWYSNGVDITHVNGFGTRCQDTAWVFENASYSSVLGCHVDGLIASAVFTFDQATDKILCSAHGLANDIQIKLYTTGALPTGFTVGAAVYVVNKTTNDFQLANSPGGAAITFTTNGTGVHTWKQFAGAGLAIGVAGNTTKVGNSVSATKIRNVIAPVEFGLFGANTNTGNLDGTVFDDIEFDCPGAGFALFLFYPNPQNNPGHLTYGGRITNTTIRNCKAVNSNGLQGIYATQFDGLTVENNDFAINGAALQTAEGSPTKLLVKGNTFDIDSTIAIQIGTGADIVRIDGNTIRGTVTLAHGVYLEDTSTNVTFGPNYITGASLANTSGISTVGATALSGFSQYGPQSLGAMGSRGSYAFGRVGEYGGIEHRDDIAPGVVHLKALLRAEIVVNGVTALAARSNGTIANVGIGGDFSDIHARLPVAASTANDHAVSLRPGVAPTNMAEGSIDNVDGVGFTGAVSVATATFTAANATNVFTSVAHGLQNGDTINVTTSGALPTGLSVNVPYYVINRAADTFKLSLTSGGSAVDITTDGTGTQTWRLLKPYHFAMKVAAIAYNFNTVVNANTTSDITITGVTGARTTDVPSINFGAAGLTSGLECVGYWVSAADTVIVRIKNGTGGNITPNENWTVSAVRQ